MYNIFNRSCEELIIQGEALMKRPGLFSVAVVLAVLSLACGFGPRLDQPSETEVVALMPTETQPPATKAPTNTAVPTETPLPPTVTPTATPEPIDYVITDPAFDVEVDDSCNGDIEIHGVEGDSFSVSGTIPMINSAWVVWCYGAKHTWFGTLEYSGYTFASNEAAPLQFMITREGYRYVSGTGVVTEPDGTQVELIGAGSAQTSGQDDNGAPTAFPTQAPTAAPLLPAASVLDQTGFEVVLEDQFGGNQNNWPLGDDDNDYATMNWEIEDGVYTWSIDSKQGLNWYIHPEIDSYSDFIVSVDVRHVFSSQNDDDAGLLIRRMNDSNFCNFMVDEAGDYTFQCLVGGEWDIVLDWTYTDAFNPGDVNNLAVQGIGSHFIFVINNVVVDEVDFDKIQRGRFGLAADVYLENTEAVYEFDNFILLAPEE
jgi:hypothetical protein